MSFFNKTWFCHLFSTSKHHRKWINFFWYVCAFDRYAFCILMKLNEQRKTLIQAINFGVQNENKWIFISCVFISILNFLKSTFTPIKSWFEICIQSGLKCTYDGFCAYPNSMHLIRTEIYNAKMHSMKMQWADARSAEATNIFYSECRAGSLWLTGIRIYGKHVRLLGMTFPFQFELEKAISFYHSCTMDTGWILSLNPSKYWNYVCQFICEDLSYVFRFKNKYR